jgi:hypothetical protein
MVKLSNAEIDDLFERSARPSVSGKGINIRGGVGVPSIGSSNTNLEPNLYNVSRDDTQAMKNKARKRVLTRDKKINGAMSEGSGFKEFAEGFQKGFTGTMKTIGTPLMDIGSEIIPVFKPMRKGVKTITGYGECEKKPLKKELGITSGGAQKPIWSDFVKGVKDTGNLSFKDALKVASEMKKGGMYKMSDINQQNIATIGNKILHP